MSTFSTKQIKDLNHMNRAAQNVNLGTTLETIASASVAAYGFVKISGSVTAGTAEAAASQVVVATGITGLKGYIVQGYTSTSQIASLHVSLTGGSNIVITAGSNVPNSTPKAVQSGDTFHYIAW
jgi:hypothetical protein